MTIVMLLGVLCLIFGALSVNIAGISIGICISKILGILCHSLLTIFEILSNISLKLPFASWIIGCPQKWKIYVFYGIVLFLYFTYVYYEKMNKSKSESKKSYYLEGMKMLFDTGETVENFQDIIAQYKEALTTRTEIIENTTKALRNEVPLFF